MVKTTAPLAMSFVYFVCGLVLADSGAHVIWLLRTAQ